MPPLLSIPTAVLRCLPLLLCRRAEPDFTVDVEAGDRGRLTVGRIMRVSRASGRQVWFWTVTGPYTPQATAGEEETLPEAQQAFRRAFDRLLAWSDRERGGLQHWHVGAHRLEP